MNIKNAISKIMFKIFAAVSFIGFLILGCVTDVGAEGFKNYIYLVLGWFICMFIAAMLYDYRIIFRHLYAIVCVILLVFGYLTKIRTETFIELYKLAIDAGSIYDYYGIMLEIYDFSHQRKDDT